MIMLNLVVAAGAIYCGVRFWDRLRQINWRDTRPVYVGLYLGHMLWCLAVIWESAANDLNWSSAIGVVAMACWLEISKHNWQGGPPVAAVKAAEPMEVTGLRGQL